MIGGEFDLSAGVAVTSLGADRVDVQLPVHHERLGRRGARRWWSRWSSGSSTADLVVKTGMPSFIVTLGTFFMLHGPEPGAHQADHRQRRRTDDVSNMQGFASAREVFASSASSIGGVDIKITRALVDRVRRRSRPGCCCAPSRQLDLRRRRRRRRSARAVGVPVDRVEDRPVHGRRLRGLVHRHAHPVRVQHRAVRQGVGNEFIYIIAAVVGGCLLTGGYGSAIGAAIGAFIFGMTNQGIVYAGWNPDWFKFFLGALLLGAILLNVWVRAASGGNAMTTTTQTPAAGRRPRRRRTPLVQLADAGKHYGNIIALQRRRPGGQRRRGHLRAGRQRRRQVHPDQDHRRPAPARRGHLRGRGQAGALRLAPRGPRPRASPPSTRTSPSSR